MSRSRRPAEAQLPDTIQSLRHELLDGFATRAAAVKWFQRLCVRTLGEISCDRYRQFAIEFRADGRYDEGTKLACFLSPAARTRDIDDAVARNFREHWAANVITPTQTDAFRSIRSQATEYVGDDEDREEAGYDADSDTQSLALRPALEELDEAQATVVDQLLGDGLEDRAEILDWGDRLIVATRGEPVADGRKPGTLVRDLYNDASGDRIMCDERTHWRRYRQFYIMYQLLPAFNRAVQDLTNRAVEEPQVDNTPEDIGGSQL